MSKKISNEQGLNTIMELYKSLLVNALSLEPAIETFGGDVKYSVKKILDSFEPKQEDLTGFDDFDIKAAILDALVGLSKGSKFTIAEFIMMGFPEFDKDKVVYKVGYTAGRMEKAGKLESFRSGNKKVYMIAKDDDIDDIPFDDDEKEDIKPFNAEDHDDLPF